MDSLVRCLHDLATKLIVGKIINKFDKKCKYYILGKGALIYLFTYLLIN